MFSFSLCLKFSVQIQSEQIIFSKIILPNKNEYNTCKNLGFRIVVENSEKIVAEYQNFVVSILIKDKIYGTFGEKSEGKLNLIASLKFQ